MAKTSHNSPLVEPTGYSVCGSAREDVFDREELSARVDGDEEFLCDLARLFVEESSRLLDRIREAFSRSDSDALTYAAHTLKGVAGNLGGKRAASAAQRIEILGRQGNLDTAAAGFEDLTTEIDLLRTALENEISRFTTC